MQIGNYEVLLKDEGTLDTIITVDGCRHSYDQEFAAPFRSQRSGVLDDEGFADLAKIAIEDHCETCLMDPQEMQARERIYMDDGEALDS